MFCPNCGTAVPDGQAFCNNCGVPLNNQQKPFQAPPPPPYYQQNQPVPGAGFGIASLILGLISLLFFCFVFISVPCAIAGIALGAVSLVKAKAVGMRSGTAIGGIVISAVTLFLVVLIYSLIFATVIELGGMDVYF